MPGFVPGIHVLILIYAGKDVDGRDKPGHDESKTLIVGIIGINHSAGLAAAAAAARSAATRFSTIFTDQTEPS